MLVRRLLPLVLLSLGPLAADVRLPALFGDHMVIQRGLPVHVWGWAEPGEPVEATFAGSRAATEADSNGDWSLYLPPVEAGGPHELTVSGGNTLRFTDVLAGDVWLASGQSNMVWPVSRSIDAEREIAAADCPKIRLFQVKLETAEEPKEDVSGSWSLCGPETIGGFSAVAYFFARNLEQTVDAPIGLVQSAWGGTPAEAWTSREALEDDPSLGVFVEKWRAVLAEYPRAHVRYEQALEEWQSLQNSSGGEAPPRPREPRGAGHPHAPATLYNAMIAPLTPFPIRGALWYQGENNANQNEGYEYRRLFQTMILDWRESWGVGPFPFLFVQLANYARVPDESQWPELREAQAMALDLVNTGMATAIDIGESEDIHPRNKQEVGRRLALAARAVAYGEDDLVYSGPIYRQMTIEGGDARIWFDSVGKGLEAREGDLKGFEIAGPDGRFHSAQARIEGDTVVVSSEKVSRSIAVRYGWAADPELNLYNEAGLPAPPFRTDDWR